MISKAILSLLDLGQANICDNERRPENQKACHGQPFGALVPYPGDCAKFLVCNCEYPTVKDCPGGTWFDDKIKVCNYPQYVDCKWGNGGESSSTQKPTVTTPTTSTSTSPVSTTSTETPAWGEDCKAPPGMSANICEKYNDRVLLRYPYNCNAYINCTMGCPVMDYCQSDKVFNNLLKICDTPDTAQCVELPMPSTTISSTTEELTTEEPTTTTEESTTSSTEKTTTTEEPTTTSSTTEETSSTTPEISSSSTEETTTELTSPTIEPDQCLPVEGMDSDICSNSEIYHSYPYNCRAFVMCKDSEPCLGHCKDGKIFNSLLGICDDDLECEELPLPSTNSPETTWPLTTDSSSQETSLSTTEAPCISTTLPPEVDPNMCQNKEDYTTYPYERDCSQYLQCQGGEVKILNCPQGWLFNAELLMCDKASESVCYTTPASTTPEYTTTEEPIYDLCIGQPQGTTFPFTENCQMYYYCLNNGHFYMISCPLNNYYDPISGNCGPDVLPTACQEQVKTTVATTTELTTLSPKQMCENQKEGTTFPYVENCSKYVFCLGNGGYVLMPCPSNNYYYPEEQECGPSEDVNICRKPMQTTTNTPSSTTELTTLPISTTSPNLNICGNYDQGQLIEYPDNCQKYISCVKPIPVGFYCNNDWFFNVQQQKCVADEEGTCSGSPSNGTTPSPGPSDICEGLEEGDSQSYKSDCQLYYECLGNGNYMLRSCDQGEFYDPLKGHCSSQVDAEYCKHNFESTTPEVITTPTPKPTPAPKPQGICEGQKEGWLIPYPRNCSKFIMCKIPISVGFNCPSGLEFSSAQQECVEPNESDCGLVSSSTLEPTTKPTNQCTGKPDYTQLPYEKNCSMFLLCKQDVVHLVYCRKGEYFDLDQGECVQSSNEDSCRVGSTTEITTPTTEVTTPDPNLGPCYNKPDGSKIPYPNNCTKYIVCQDPLSVGYDCPEGLEFSKHDQECVIPELADCSIKTTMSPTTVTTTPNTPLPAETCIGKPNGSTLPYPKDCSKYYMCLNGQEKLTQCMPQSFYDPNTGECDGDVSPEACKGSITTKAPTTSPEDQGSCEDKSNGFIYPNMEDCSQYFMCLNHTASLCQCESGSYYNPYTEECDEEISSEACKEAKTTKTTESGDDSTSKKTTEATKTTPEATKTTPEVTNTTPEPTTPTSTSKITTASTTTITTESPSPREDNICCGKKSGTQLSYPGDNTKYVICQYPLPEVHNCPEESTYDEKTSKCKLNAAAKPVCNASNVSQSFPYIGDCTKYYFCFGSEPVLMDCMLGYNYKPASKRCVSKRQYPCPW